MKYHQRKLDRLHRVVTGKWVPIYFWVWLKRKSQGTRGPRKQNLVSEDLGLTMRTVISQSSFIPASSCFIYTPALLSDEFNNQPSPGELLG